MNKIDIKTKDWNLLAVFESLFRTGNVSQSAVELSLSQSAVSHSLARLREMFQDPLFTRLPRGVAPTPRAIELAPQIIQLTQQMHRLFDTKDFSPETVHARVSIASTEYLELALLKSMFESVRRTASGVQLQFRNTSGKLPKLQMEKGEIDIAIAGFFGNLPDGFYQQTLFVNDFVCVARKGHPALKSKLTLESYTKLEHLLLSPQGDLWGLIDDILMQKKRSRRVVAGFENYLTPGWYVAGSDMVVTVPRYLGNFYEANLNIELFELPFPSPKITIVQAWHERTHSSAVHKFIRQKIAEGAKNLA